MEYFADYPHAGLVMVLHVTILLQSCLDGLMSQTIEVIGEWGEELANSVPAVGVETEDRNPRDRLNLLFHQNCLDYVAYLYCSHTALDTYCHID